MSNRPKLLHPFGICCELVLAYRLRDVLKCLQEVLHGQWHIDFLLHIVKVVDVEFRAKQLSTHGHHGRVTAHVGNVCTRVALREGYEFGPVHNAVLF